MNPSNTAKLALPFLQPGQALKTITHNEALHRLDAGLYLSCSDMNAADIPSAPPEGFVLILSPDFSETIAANAGDIGVFQNESWQWFTPVIGWTLWDHEGETLRVFNGENWVAPTPNSAPEIYSHLGLNTSANSIQRLAIASQSSLFTHDGDSHRMTINRAADADTASLIFQTNYSGSVELGLNGPDGFSLKASPDGVNWSERLSTPKDYSGVRAPAFSSVAISIDRDQAKFIETPANGGIFAITIVKDDDTPQGRDSSLMTYDTGSLPNLASLAVTGRIENHGHQVLDGLVGTDGSIGISVVTGGLYVENRLRYTRQFSVTFLC